MAVCASDLQPTTVGSNGILQIVKDPAQ